MLITDTVTLGDVRVNDAGYLETFAHTARTGVQQYLGREAGRPEVATVSVYRDEAEVFSKRSLDTFSKIPVTVDHPSEPVTSANWKKHAVGTTGEEVLRDGERLKIGLKITDKAAVDAIRAGKRELSVGYSTELVWEDGIAPDGTPYQARQTNIVADHIAIVSAGRAGPQCRIGDSWSAFSAPQKDPSMTLKTVTVDGIPIEVTDQGATVIGTLQQRLADANTKLADAITAHERTIAAKDAALAKAEAERDAANAKVLTDAALDARVQARADLIQVAGLIAKDVKTAGLSDAAIKKAVVVAKLGDAALPGKSEAYTEARFDILADEARKADPVRDALNGGHAGSGASMTVDASYAAMLERDRNAWRSGAQKEA